MFSATVAQKPTIPVSDGMKKRKKSALDWNLLGALRTGPRPPASLVIHHSSSNPTANMNGAAMPSRYFIVSMPRRITNMFSAQNAKKQIQSPDDELRAAGQTIT